jgi:hypothetical protein
MLMLAAMPFGLQLGLTVSLAGGAVVLITFYLSSPIIEVGASLRVGSFNIPLHIIGEVQSLSGEDLRNILGPKSDARARMVIRGYLPSAVKVELTDANDPTPYLVISTRRPQELAVALLANRP